MSTSKSCKQALSTNMNTNMTSQNMNASNTTSTKLLLIRITTAGDWDCVAAVERLPALHYIYFLVLWDHGFHCGTLKLLEGH